MKHKAIVGCSNSSLKINIAKIKYKPEAKGVAVVSRPPEQHIDSIEIVLGRNCETVTALPKNMILKKF